MFKTLKHVVIMLLVAVKYWYKLSCTDHFHSSVTTTFNFYKSYTRLGRVPSDTFYGSGWMPLLLPNIRRFGGFKYSKEVCIVG